MKSFIEDDCGGSSPHPATSAADLGVGKIGGGELVGICGKVGAGSPRAAWRPSGRLACVLDAWLSVWRYCLELGPGLPGW